jgi:hypothetical protein
MADDETACPLVELAGDDRAERLDRCADAGKVVLLGVADGAGNLVQAHVFDPSHQPSTLSGR